MIIYVLSTLGILCFTSYALTMKSLLESLVRAVNGLNESIQGIQMNTTVNNHSQAVAPLSTAMNMTSSFLPSSKGDSNFDQDLMKDLAQFKDPSKEDTSIKLNLESKTEKIDNQAQGALEFLKKKKDKE